jgi:HEPN domain-containing protein
LNRTVQGIERLPRDQQDRVLRKIDDIIVETFINSADVDYVTARFQYLGGAHRAFFWSALQAIEKYLKATFLFNGVSVKNKKSFGHNIFKMAERLNNDYKVFKDVELKPVGEHAYLEEIRIWGSYDPMEFIREIETFGKASNRYNYFGASYEASYLAKLDQLVQILRSFSIVDYPLYGTKEKDCFDYAAFEQNFPFAPAEYNQGSMFGKFAAGRSTPSIKIALHGGYCSSKIFEDWLLENISITEAEIVEIKKR